MNKTARLRGFTLIELIVVIGIIAILAAIVLIAINPNRQFALSRNTQRRSDILAILNAIYQYSTDNNGVIPTTMVPAGNANCGNDFTNSANLTAGAGAIPAANREDGTGSSNGVVLAAPNMTSLAPTYIAAIPQDPTTKTAADYQVCQAAVGGRISVYALQTETSVLAAPANLFRVTR